MAALARVAMPRRRKKKLNAQDQARLPGKRTALPTGLSASRPHDGDGGYPPCQRRLSARTVSTSTATFSGGVNWEMPWPRLNTWPG